MHCVACVHVGQPNSEKIELKGAILQHSVKLHGTIAPRLTLILTNGSGIRSSFYFSGGCPPAKEFGVQVIKLPRFLTERLLLLARAWSPIDLQYDEKSSQHLPQSWQGPVRYHGSLLGPQQR